MVVEGGSPGQSKNRKVTLILLQSNRWKFSPRTHKGNVKVIPRIKEYYTLPTQGRRDLALDLRTKRWSCLRKGHVVMRGGVMRGYRTLPLRGMCGGTLRSNTRNLICEDARLGSRHRDRPFRSNGETRSQRGRHLTPGDVPGPTVTGRRTTWDSRVLDKSVKGASQS